MSWDVDGNGQFDALTDGKLVLGYLFGFTGEALIRNSLAPDATRTQAAQIIDYLESIRDQLDVDGNGEIDALTDAILYLRYLFGFTGESLTGGAVGAGATRDRAEQVIAYLESITEEEASIPIETGSTLDTATNVSIASTNRTYTSEVGGTSASGYLEFSLGATNEFDLSLSNLSADANVEIIDQQSGEVILSSTNAGMANESISGMLNTGSYGIHIFSADGARTNYNLDLSVMPQLDGITTGGSDVPIQTTTNVSGPLINIDDFRPDPRFTGVDGSGFAAVILDTGINLDHPFFGPDNNNDGIADRIVYHQDFADDDFNASDRNGHGSNVSSIVASSDSTFTGIAPGADIIHLKVFLDSGGGSFGYIEQALQWVVENVEIYNIASVNMSLGDVVDSDGDRLPDISGNYRTPQRLYDIDDELAALAAQNVIVVSASGNDFFGHNSEPGVAYPAADPNSLSIGAVYDSNVGGLSYRSGAQDFRTDADRITSFSQRHPTLTTVFAPGALITGAAANNNGTLIQGGTSQAAPHVAGMAVLAQQLAVQELGRRLTPGEFSDLLVSTGVTINDGDDENDNVTNTGLDFRRADMFALAEAILALAPSPANRPPVAANDSATIDAGTTATIAVLANDSDLDGDAISLDSFATRSAAGGAVTRSGNSLVYRPASGFAGNDSFSYTISDGNGGTDSATVNVTVESVNQPPRAVNDTAITDENSSVTIAVLANDVDPDGDPILVTGVSSPGNGSANISNNQIIYSPAANFVGNDSFNYTISDGSLTATATVTVTVESVNQPPIAVDDTASVQENSPVTIAVLVNDSDPDGDLLSLTGVSSPGNGSANISNNQIIYSPDADFAGNDSFRYTISDAQDTDTATVTVTVESVVNQPPIAIEDIAATTPGVSVSIPVLENDSDPDGDAISIDNFPTSTPSGGTIALNDDLLEYTPGDGFAETDSFSYSISDGNGATATAFVIVVVENDPNDPPIAIEDIAATTPGVSVSIPVLENDSDPDGDAISIADFPTSTPSGGTIALNDDLLEYTPGDGFAETDSFSYSISDGNGATATAFVIVIVDENPPILSNNLAFNTASGSPIAQNNDDVLLYSPTSGLTEIDLPGSDFGGQIPF
ncbi:MAG: Ig-like domain-containing protein [Hormoscilla sp.]